MSQDVASARRDQTVALDDDGSPSVYVWGADSSGAPPPKPAPIHHVTGVRMVPSGVKAGYAGTRVISKTRV